MATRAATEGTDASPRGGVQVISRAASILRLLSQEPSGLTIAQVVDGTGLAKSTAYRLLLALQNEELVESFDNRFRIGPILGSTAMSNVERVRLRARPFMEGLASELQETVDLSVLVGDQIMIVDQMRWTRELTAGSLVGALLPAYETANGRAMLAAAPAHREFVLDSIGHSTGVDPAAIEAELEQIRKTKIAVVGEGVHKGISGIATFAESDGQTTFALGVPVPSVRFWEQLDRLRDALLAARPEFERIVNGR